MKHPSYHIHPEVVGEKKKKVSLAMEKTAEKSQISLNLEEQQFSNSQDASTEATMTSNIDPKDERSVLLKIDLIIMPAMTLVYFFQYLDKQTINYASVFGLNEDLSLTGQEYSWVVTIFYFGQLASEFPCSYFMSRFPVTRVVGICM